MGQLDAVIERVVASSAGTVDMKLEVVVIPFRMSIAPSASTETWAGASMPTSSSATHFVSPIHASRLPMLDPLRHRAHVGRAGLGKRTLSCRIRHRGSARRAGRSRRRCERRVPPCRSGQAARQGPHPARSSYFSYATFHDPDGNEWLLQEVTTRFPGRIDSNATSFACVSDLASAMRRASAAHGEHETRMGGQRDENWPDGTPPTW